MPDRPLDTDFLFLLYDVARLMRTRADQRARTTGMTRAQWVILVWLEREPGLSQNELAALVEVEPITVARLIDKLEARGAVERRPDPKDRRIRRLHLTEAARPLLEHVHAYRSDSQELLCEGLTPEALKITAETLLRMKANLLDETRLSRAI
ncbi:MAG: transcriptional regulator, MarR family [Hyphomicrobiales bacterium]|nr:transcriptional regulator, MarR family [Hyphomicrobiales bacterium]